MLNFDGLSELQEQLLEASTDLERRAAFKAVGIEEEDLLRSAVVAVAGEEMLELLKPGDFDHLREVEAFYAPAGGLIGYQLLALDLMNKKTNDPPQLIQPQPIDLREEKRRHELSELGITHLDRLAFLCPIGGAGDRFGLADPGTHEPWPLARLEFLGRPLFERLVLDVLGLEQAYARATGCKVEIPIGLMTSDEKSNDAHIWQLLEEAHFFGRSRSSFFVFKQPLVPAFDKTGQWIATRQEGLHLKPGGHGMIWRAAEQSGFFDELEKRGKAYLLIRQINNPIASLDDGLLAFYGAGLEGKKRFGFASCPRQVGAKEGMNVVKRDGLSYTLTNIEYTDFERYRVEDRASDGSRYSVFPSNTNILFAKLKSVRAALDQLPFPGPVLNFKGGDRARLELMMQNIADALGERFAKPQLDSDLGKLGTYLTYNKRERTISVTKQQWAGDDRIDETPVGALWSWLEAMQAFLKGAGFEVPALEREAFVKEGASFLFDFDPRLGPRFCDLKERLRGGRLHPGSALILHTPSALIEGIDCRGTCLIAGYGACHLKHVKIAASHGLPRDLNQLARGGWPADVMIYLEPGSSLYAENVTIEPGEIRVRAGEALHLS